MIGDVVGEPGLKALEDKLPGIIKDNTVDFTVVNGENSADGFGMTEAALKRIIVSGVNAVTSGNGVLNIAPSPRGQYELSAQGLIIGHIN